jgi:GxxExxY protein
MHINEISGQIIDAAIKVHSKLGPGILESVYETLLAYELRKRGLQVQRQVPVSIVYDDVRFDEGFRLDLLVEDRVIIELKSVEEVTRVHKKQLLTYLRLHDKRLGLLLNFNVDLLKDGITRLVNQLGDE